MRTTCRSTAYVLVAYLLMAGAWSGETGPRHSIVGTWELVSFASGLGKDDPLGVDPVGLIVYDSTGTVAAQLMRRHRDVSDKANARAAPGQRAAVVGGYVAYFGRYSVDLGASTVTHRIQGALAPSDIGRVLVRQFRMEGDDLVLEFGVGPDFRRLRWRKL
jgi:hypothetical protein